MLIRRVGNLLLIQNSPLKIEHMPVLQAGKGFVMARPTCVLGAPVKIGAGLWPAT